MWRSACAASSTASAPQTVHDDLDLDVMRGEILGVIGGSGTGKSVLLRSIVGLDKPIAGEIEVFGETLNDLSREERVRSSAAGA